MKAQKQGKRKKRLAKPTTRRRNLRRKRLRQRQKRHGTTVP
jgi:hypothetical protein